MNTYWYQGKVPDFAFNGKELDEESGMYYFEARYMKPPMFIQRDPKFERYPHLSPYSAMANSPLLVVDPDGQKIKFAKGVSAEFKAQFKQAVQHLNAHKVGGTMARVEASPVVYYVTEGTPEKGSKFSTGTRTVSWNPTEGLLTDKGVVLSPTTILNHEFGHVENYDKAARGSNEDIKQYNENAKYDPNNLYDSKEEEKVITGIEQVTAKALGEIEEGEVTRTNHKGKLKQTEGVTSNVLKGTVVVTASKIKEKEE
jgi:RHS repeat-associated protein